MCSWSASLYVFPRAWRDRRRTGGQSRSRVWESWRSTEAERSCWPAHQEHWPANEPHRVMRLLCWSSTHDHFQSKRLVFTQAVCFVCVRPCWSNTPLHKPPSAERFITLMSYTDTHTRLITPSQLQAVCSPPSPSRMSIHLLSSSCTFLSNARRTAASVCVYIKNYKGTDVSSLNRCIRKSLILTKEQKICRFNKIQW